VPPSGKVSLLRLLLWFLPVVDLFTLPRILAYYKGKRILVPRSHAKLAMVERWAGYLPAGLLLGRWLGPPMSLLLFLFGLLLAGPPELFLMGRGRGPWGFLRGKGEKLLVGVFLLEGYNALGYFSLGLLLSLL
jgi:hypothetical protein